MAGPPATGFIAEMRTVAMKLHTREQAPKEGQAERKPESKPMPQVRASPGRVNDIDASLRSFVALTSCVCRVYCVPVAQWQPTREGYLSFLVESKAVYDAMEGVMASGAHPMCTWLHHSLLHCL